MVWSSLQKDWIRAKKVEVPYLTMNIDVPAIRDKIAYLEYRFGSFLRPLRILLEGIDTGDSLSTELGYGFFQLWVKDIDKEVVEE